MADVKPQPMAYAKREWMDLRRSRLRCGWLGVALLCSACGLDRRAEQMAHVREGVEGARELALREPLLTEAEREVVRRERPRLPVFIDLGMIVECRYVWELPGGREVVVKYSGDPVDGGRVAGVFLVDGEKR